MTPWHAAPELLTLFASTPGALDDVTASSVEAHLLGCDQCRRAVAAAARPEVVAATWGSIADRIDRPRPTLAERLLGRLLPQHVARVVAATTALRLSWLAAVTLVTVAVAVAARHAGTDTPFLILAPLVPLAGVAASFGPAPDPAGEAAVATPMHGAGLVMWRTAAVLATSLMVLGIGSLALPGFDLHDLGWVLPAAALTLGSVALSTWVAPVTATMAAGMAWAVALEVAALVDGVPRPVAAGPLFGPAAQVAFAVLTGLALLVLEARRHQLSTMEAR